MEKAVVYMVAGMSSRFRGKIKQFAEVGQNGETLIEVSIGQALEAGFKRIIFVVGEKTEGPFRNKFGENYLGAPVKYALQKFDSEKRDRPWGTTDALCSAREAIENCPFVVCNGDDLYGVGAFREIYKALDSNDAATVGYRLGNVLPESGSVNRGIFKTEDGYVLGIREEIGLEKGNLSERGLDGDQLCSMNMFGLHQKVMGLLCDNLEKFKTENSESRDVESFLPKDLSNLIDSGQIKIKISPTNERWYGVTNPGDEVSVRESLARESLH